MMYLYLKSKQIDKICALVEEDMEIVLGYRPRVVENSNKGEETRFRLTNLEEGDFTEAIRDQFTERTYYHMLIVGKVFDG